ncbi:MAG: IPT/TIG domain-containing protein [Candidatus Nomurabacteria bacterium]|jgi:uncharacterized protein (TIGR02145 family)|nr:IPT/TIG domain-containing protein [Candidatus Nomurabacteria bacterium]
MRKLSVGLFIALVSSFAATALVSALAITNITPNTGTVNGGNIVTITGSGFEPDVPALQNFGADRCTTMTVYNGSNIGALLVLKDTRGGQIYTVGKLADGNCWMLNNLKLGSETNSTPLTTSDTNITRNWTLPQVSGAAVSYSYTAPLVFTYSPQSSDINDPTFYGYYYNWCAATAGDPATCTASGVTPADATQDICPVNWRLPRGGPDTDANNEFSQLSAAMAGVSFSSYANDWTMKYAANWQFDGPFRGVFSGGYGNSDQGTIGTLWSSSYSRYSAPSQAHFWYLGATFVGPEGSASRGYPYSVRCLAKTGTVDTNPHYDLKPSVTVGGAAVDAGDVEVVSGTELRVKMPAHAAGVVDIAITLGGVSQTVQYEYLPSAPNTGVGRITTDIVVVEIGAAIVASLGATLAWRRLVRSKR